MTYILTTDAEGTNHLSTLDLPCFPLCGKDGRKNTARRFLANPGGRKRHCCKRCWDVLAFERKAAA